MHDIAITLLFHFVIGYAHKVHSWENSWSVMSSSKTQHMQVTSCDIHHTGHVILYKPHIL